MQTGGLQQQLHFIQMTAQEVVAEYHRFRMNYLCLQIQDSAPRNHLNIPLSILFEDVMS